MTVELHNGKHVLIVIDEVVKFMEKDGPVTREELVPLFLGILDVTPAENPLRPPAPF